MEVGMVGENNRGRLMMEEEFLDRQSDITGGFPQRNRGSIPSHVRVSKNRFRNRIQDRDPKIGFMLPRE